MRFLSNSKYFLLLSFFLFSSCEEEVDSNALVFAEDVIFVSGEILRITGRVVASGQVTISDHGFQIADNPEFTSPIIVSLGERSVPGRFVGIYEHLTTGTDFYVRAFLINKGESKYSAPLEFTTLEPELVNFYPLSDAPGRTLTLIGKNLTRDSEVYFGTTKALILEFNNEAEIKVRIPSPVIGEFSVPIRVITDGKENVYPKKFEFIVGKWDVVALYPGNLNIERNTYFQHDGKLYTGMERRDGIGTQLFYTYDPVANLWSQKEFNGDFVEIPSSFEGGFFGGRLGATNGVTSVTNDFWALDTSGDFIHQGTVPFELWVHVSFKVGNELYVFGGMDAVSTHNNRIRKYNFDTKEWIDLGAVPIVLSTGRPESLRISNRQPAFRHNDQMYFINAENELWQYNSSTKEWSQKASYPGETSNLAVGSTLGSYAYVGLGHKTREMYEYEFATDIWRSKTIPPGLIDDVTLGWYTLGDDLYILRKQQSTKPKMHRFQPFNY